MDQLLLTGKLPETETNKCILLLTEKINRPKGNIRKAKDNGKGMKATRTRDNEHMNGRDILFK